MMHDFKQLSSRLQFPTQVLSPLFILVFFGLQIYWQWADDSIHPTASRFKWQFTIIMCFLATAAFLGCLAVFGDLKRVRLTSDSIRVSDGLKEVCIPLTLISDVTENQWLNYHPVTIHFRSRTVFGKAVSFMPTMKNDYQYRSHPVVAELKQLALGKIQSAGSLSPS